MHRAPAAHHLRRRTTGDLRSESPRSAGRALRVQRRYLVDPAPSPRAMPLLRDVALAPNGLSLIAITRDTINEISLTDNLFMPVSCADNPFPLCGGFFDQAAREPRKVLRGLPARGVIWNHVRISLRYADSFTELRDVAQRGGSRIYAGSNGISSPPAEIFDSLSNTTSSGSAILHLYAGSVSGDASRVVLQNSLVDSRSLTLLGNVPDHGPVLASRDSSRAFIYAEDGPGPGLEVYNLNGPLQAGALYPLLKT